MKSFAFDPNDRTNSNPLTVDVPTPSLSKPMVWTGRVLSTLIFLFMAMDGVMKLVKPAPVVESFTKLGFRDDSSSVGLGLILLASTLLYAFPRTAILGAVLLTGYLGGAVAINLRADTSSFNLAFPVVFGIITWGGLWLRDREVRALLPIRRS